MTTPDVGRDDPDEALADIRELAGRVRFSPGPGLQIAAGEELAEALEWLDAWLAAGGRLPQAWSVAPAAEPPVVTDPDPAVREAAQALHAAIDQAEAARAAQRTASVDLTTAARELAAARRRYTDLRGGRPPRPIRPTRT